MSKTVKRKVSVELQKPSSKSRLSVFQRLGTKKSKSLSESKSLTDDFKQTLSAAVSITTKPILSKSDAVELEDADPDILEKKREEIRKELELQMKMDSRRMAARKRKHAETTSSSSSSGSDSESTSSSSSSSSSDNRHARKLKSKRRDSSSSSDEYAKKLAKKKRACQKKEALKLHKLSKKHEIVVSRKAKKRSPSPLAKKHRSDVMLSPSGQKVLVKSLKISTSVDKHHRIREKEVERNELLQRSERERLRLREEHIRSRSPKMAQARSRTPKRERSPIMRRSPSDKRNRSLSRRLEPDHDRREREREIAREKERRDALLRCQERQKERERLAKDSKSQRLLPRPAERAMALKMAAQERNTDKDVPPPYSNRSFTERTDSFEHRRHEKESREHDRSYEKYETHNRREPSEYQHTSSYRRDWHEETAPKDLYERPTEHQSAPRDWDHKRSDNVRPGEYTERKDWSDSTPKWVDSRKPTEKYERRGQTDYPPHAPTRSYSDRTETFDPNATSSVSKPIGSSIRGRWNSSWRGRGRGGHHTEFRRTHHHTEILEERGEIYRRHINPQGTNTSKPATITKPSDCLSGISNEKNSDDASKSLNVDDNADEEIADDLSEISDEADDILGQQEDINPKSQSVEPAADKSIDGDSKEVVNQPTKDVNESDAVEKSIEHNESTQSVDQLTSSKTPEEIDRTKDLTDDIDLDFEEISDGELEEEARTKGLGDALGVDWSSLIEESKALMREKLTKSETPVKQRWHPDQILLDVGVSYKMAGADFAQNTLINAHENVKQEMNLIKIKTEPIDDSNHMDIDIKMENDTENDAKVAKVNGKLEQTDKVERNLILHPLPCVQTSIQSFAEKQHRLVFKAAGPYSRGLCTKRDIGMRRQLCNLAINESNCKSANTRTGYENIALKLFQKALQA